MTQDQLWTVYERSPLFVGIPTARLQQLLEGLPPPRVYEKGDTVYSRHRFERALGLVLQGQVEVVRCPGAHTVRLNRVNTGEMFGAAALFDDGEYVTEIRAVRHSVVCFFPQETVRQLMRREPQVAENYVRFLTERVRFLNRRIAAFTAGAAARKAARYLWEHRGTDGRVAPPANMAALAASLDMSRSSLYRAWDTLEQEGCLRRQNGHWLLPDEQQLRLWID